MSLEGDLSRQLYFFQIVLFLPEVSEFKTSPGCTGDRITIKYSSDFFHEWTYGLLRPKDLFLVSLFCSGQKQGIKLRLVVLPEKTKKETKKQAKPQHQKNLNTKPGHQKPNKTPKTSSKSSDIISIFKRLSSIQKLTKTSMHIFNISTRFRTAIIYMKIQLCKTCNMNQCAANGLQNLMD